MEEEVKSLEGREKEEVKGGQEGERSGVEGKGRIEGRGWEI